VEPAWAQGVTTFAGTRGVPGSVDGPVGQARLKAPGILTAIPGGGFALIDLGDQALKRIDAAGQVTTVMSGLDGPFGLAADTKGNLYVSSSLDSVIFQISPSGAKTILAGRTFVLGNQDGPGSTATFTVPGSLAMTSRGLVVADLFSGRIRLVDVTGPVNVSTLVTGLYHPSALAVGANGTVYIVEGGTSRILAMSPTNVVTVVAGNGRGYRDGSAVSSQLMPWLGLAVLPDGTLAFSDAGSYRVRGISIATGLVSTLAGTGRFGQRLGSGDVTDIVAPAGLAAGPDGTLYLAEPGNADIVAIKR